MNRADRLLRVNLALWSYDQQENGVRVKPRPGTQYRDTTDFHCKSRIAVDQTNLLLSP